MKQLSSAFEKLNIPVSSETLSKFEKYMRLVLAWNEKVNLTAITEEDEFIQKHFIDSILCANFDEVKSADTVIDVGTGAGFPGVPLALVFPEKHFLLIDSTGKKIRILREILDALDVSRVTVLHARAEELARKEEYREKFDLCVSRAVANMTVLSGYCLPFVKPGGSFIAYKGPEVTKELAQAQPEIKRLGGKVKDIRKAALEGFGFDHSLVVIEKGV